MRAICSALCNPADTFLGNSSEQGGHHIDGVASTCADRGAAGKDCVYGWFFEVADDGAHVPTRYSNLGVCMDWTRYQRSDGTQLKSCAELAANPDANLDEAFQQGCRPLSAHPGAHRLMPQLHLLRLP